MEGRLINLAAFDWEIDLTTSLSTFFGGGTLHWSVEFLSDFKRTAFLIPFLMIALWRRHGTKITIKTKWWRAQRRINFFWFLGGLTLETCATKMNARYKRR